MNKIVNLIIPATVILLLISCQNENSNGNGSNRTDEITGERPLTEEELKEQLHETECIERSKYIGGTLSYEPIYKNLLSMKVVGMKLTLDLKSSATLATFKDIEIKVSFLSKTGATVLQETITVYEYIGPGDSIIDKQEIECSNQQYQDIADVNWTVVDALCD